MHEVLSGVLTQLSSISNVLSPEQLNAIVTTTIDNYSNLQFKNNNDIGLCIERLLSECPKTKNFLSQTEYEKLKTADSLSSELISGMIHGISSNLTTRLYDLRVVLPQEATSITESIQTKIPEISKSNIISNFEIFSWGKLGLESCATAAMLFAKDRLNCFKSPIMQSYDNEKILQNLPYGTSASIKDSATIQPKLENLFKVALPENPHIKLTCDILLSPTLYRKWATDVRLMLSKKQIGSVVVFITNQIDSIEEVFLQINATILNSAGIDTQETSSKLLSNIETISNNIQLIRAALLWFKNMTLADKLVIAPNVVHDQMFKEFLANGGTESMIQNYQAYLLLNEHLQFPNNGVTSTYIKDIHPKAEAVVNSKFKQLQQKSATQQAVVLQETLIHTLENYHLNKFKINTNYFNKNSQICHEDQKNRALMKLSTKSLEDVTLEYLVAMRPDKLTQNLFNKINKNMHDLVKTHTNVTSINVSEATCSAITSIVIDTLITKFAV